VKSDAANLEWWGADRGTTGDRKVTAVMPNFEGVRAKVVRKGEEVERDPPKLMRVQTVGQDERIAELTSRYKLLRGVAEFAVPSDRAEWARRREIAFAEMQLERFAQQLEKYRKLPQATELQIEHYQNRIDLMRGRWLRLTGQV
jgi:hypothetical protein